MKTTVIAAVIGFTAVMSVPATLIATASDEMIAEAKARSAQPVAVHAVGQITRVSELEQEIERQKLRENTRCAKVADIAFEAVSAKEKGVPQERISLAVVSLAMGHALDGYALGYIAMAMEANIPSNQIRQHAYSQCMSGDLI